MQALTFALAPSLLVISCGGAAPPGAGAVATPPGSPAASSSGAPNNKPDEAAKNQKVAEDAARQSAALDALTKDEAKKGVCDPEHSAALDKLLADVESGMKTRKGEDGQPLTFQTVNKRVMALGPAPRTITMTVTGRGTEVHVLAMGAREVSMDVLSAGTAATTMRSPFQRSVVSSPKLEIGKIGTVTDLESDSRVIQIKPGQPLEVKLHGQGCVLVGAFQKM